MGRQAVWTGIALGILLTACGEQQLLSGQSESAPAKAPGTGSTGSDKGEGGSEGSSASSSGSGSPSGSKEEPSSDIAPDIEPQSAATPELPKAPDPDAGFARDGLVDAAPCNGAPTTSLAEAQSGGYSIQRLNFAGASNPAHFDFIGVYEGRSDHSASFRPVGCIDVNLGAGNGTGLVLSSYEPVTWRIHATGGQMPKTILLVGYHSQRLAEAPPAGTKVLAVSYEDCYDKKLCDAAVYGKYSGYRYDGIGSVEGQNVLSELLGGPAGTAQGIYRLTTFAVP